MKRTQITQTKNKQALRKATALLSCIVMLLCAVGPVFSFAENHTHSYGQPTWSYTDKYFETVTLNVEDFNVGSDDYIILDPTGYQIGVNGTHIAKDNSLTQYVITGSNNEGLHGWLFIDDLNGHGLPYNICFDGLDVRRCNGVEIRGSGAKVNLSLRNYNHIITQSTNVFYTSRGDDDFATIKIATEDSKDSDFISPVPVATDRIVLQKPFPDYRYVLSDEHNTSYNDFSDFVYQHTRLFISGYHRYTNPFEIGKPAMVATFTCSCGDQMQLAHYITESDITVKDADCTHDETQQYHGAVTYGGRTYQGVSEEIPVPDTALGHTYGPPSWTFAEDYSSATASFTCTRCGNDTQTVVDPAPTRAQLSAATCTEDQYIQYYSRVTFGDDNKVYEGESGPVAVPNTKLGHSYGAPEWFWAEDFSSADAKFTCERGDDILVLTDAKPSVELVTPATCTTDKVADCTASVTLDGTTYTDKKEHVSILGTATGHTYGEPTWALAEKYYETVTLDVNDGNIILDPTGYQIGASGQHVDKDNSQTQYVITGSVSAMHGMLVIHDGETEAATYNIVFENLTATDGNGICLFGSNATVNLTLRGTNEITTRNYGVFRGSNKSGASAILNIATDGTTNSRFIAPAGTAVADQNVTLGKVGTSQIYFNGGEARDYRYAHQYGLLQIIGETDNPNAFNIGKTALTATFTCHCGDQQFVTDFAPQTVTVSPETCLADRTIKYVGTVSFGEQTYTGETEAIVVPGTALGHSYGEPVWSYLEVADYAIATFTCARCGDTQTVKDASPIMSEVSPAGCVTDQKIKYTGTVTFDGKSYTGDTPAITVPGTATGHSYGEPVWTWTEDYSEATAAFTCTVCGKDTQTVTDPFPWAEEFSPATHTADQVMQYEAAVQFDGKDYYTNTQASVPGTATGHNYGDPSWSCLENYSETVNLDVADGQIVIDPTGYTVFGADGATHVAKNCETTQYVITGNVSNRHGMLVIHDRETVAATYYITFENLTATDGNGVCLYGKGATVNLTLRGTNQITTHSGSVFRGASGANTGASLNIATDGVTNSRFIAPAGTAVASQNVTLNKAGTYQIYSNGGEIGDYRFAHEHGILQLIGEMNNPDAFQIGNPAVSATFTCSCGDTQTMVDTAPVCEEVSPAGCVTDQSVKYIGTVSFGGQTYSGETEAIPVSGTATGHSYGEPVWTWEDDYSAATAAFTCTLCCKDTQTVTDSSPHLTEVSPATETEDQVVIFDAKVTFDGKEYTTQTEEIAEPGTATGHSYGEPVWTWEEDYSAATATFTCTLCNEGTQMLTDSTPTVIEVAPATATEDQVVKYEASVRFGGQVYTTQTDAVSVPGTATGQPDEPDLPDKPDQPDTGKLCPWDHVNHGNSFGGRLIRFFHSILYFWAHLFGLR